MVDEEQESLSPEEELKRTLEPLLGYPAPAGLWEEDLLPSRMARYSSRDLDSLLLKGELLWTGMGRGRILFSIPEEYPLIYPPAGKEVSGNLEEKIMGLLAETPMDFSSLRESTGSAGSSDISRALWNLVWRGEIWNSRPETLRGGIRSSFKSEPLYSKNQAAGSLPGRSISRRSRFSRWKQSRPLTGEWMPTRKGSESRSGDPLEENEINKERVRLLLDRYGILFRELVNREKGFLEWRECFNALRQMEFSGEVLSGVFFRGIRGIQFITPSALECLERMDEGGDFWCSTMDPVSPCGLSLDMPGDLPVRSRTSYLVYEGGRLILRVREKRQDSRVYLNSREWRVPGIPLQPSPLPSGEAP